MEKRSEIVIHYIQVGDYYIPDISLPQPSKSMGKWGRLYRDFLKNHHPVRYNALILSGQLWDLLAQVNEQTQDRLETIINQMTSAESVTEDLKAANPVAWAGAMNNIRSRAEEVVLRELIWEEEV
ncbi:MAG TPA: TnpV protein [Candidatus Faecousia faecavium]|nr:TnpV protein [Candidatus Faecousia faecavium]